MKNHLPNQDFLKFIVQVSFSALVLVFCLGKMAVATEDKNQALFWSGITSIIAWWMPSPGNGNSNKDEKNNSPTQTLTVAEETAHIARVSTHSSN